MLALYDVEVVLWLDPEHVLVEDLVVLDVLDQQLKLEAVEHQSVSQSYSDYVILW